MLTQHFMSDSLCQQKLMELQLLLEALFNVRSTRESTRDPGAEKASLAKFCKGCTHQHSAARSVCFRLCRQRTSR